MSAQSDPRPLRRAVAFVAALNGGYFVVELAVALAIGSVSLLADSADFFEDAAVNGLILTALAWPAGRRAKLGMALSGVLLVPAAAFAWTLWRKLAHPAAPDAAWLSLAGLGSLVVNIVCAVALARYRAHAGSLTKAAFLSARNDVVAGAAIVVAGAATALSSSLWPDVLVGLGVAAMNLDAARAVWTAARSEYRATVARP